MKGVDDTGRIPEKEINWWSKYVYVFLQLSIFDSMATLFG